MVATRAAPEACDADWRFLFEGAYRPRGCLSLADRCGYGLRGPRAPFQIALQSTLHAPCSQARAPESLRIAPPTASERVRLRFKSSAILKRGDSRGRLALPDATAPRRSMAGRRGGVEPSDRRVKRPLRFTLRIDAGLLCGVVQHGRLIAARLIKERPDGNRSSG